MDLAMISGTVSTVLFACAHLPMVFKEIILLLGHSFLLLVLLLTVVCI